MASTSSRPSSPRCSLSCGRRVFSRSPLIPPSIITCATCIPCGPQSRAMVCDSERRAALAEANEPNGGRPLIEAVAPLKIMVPRPRGIIRRPASRPTRKPPRQPTRQTCSKNSASVSSSGLGKLLPALYTTQSSTPSPSFSALSNRRSTSGSRVVSVTTPVAVPPLVRMLRTRCSSLAWVRPAINTCRPSRARRWQTAPPTPTSAPTPTTIAFFFSLILPPSFSSGRADSFGISLTSGSPLIPGVRSVARFARPAGPAAPGSAQNCGHSDSINR